MNHAALVPTKTASSEALALKRSLAGSLRAKMRQNNVSVAALAKELGTGRTAVRRILDDRNTAITLNSMSKAAKAVGLRLTLEARPLSPHELGELATKLVNATSEKEAAQLTDAIMTGFYGGKAHAPDPA